MPKKISDTWSPKERKMKEKIEKIKAILFAPILQPIIKLGITPNMISAFSGLLGVVGALYILMNVKIAVWLIVGHIITDGIDGTIARKTKKDSAKGSITDAFFDQVTVVAITIALTLKGLITPGWGILYSVTYPLVTVFTIMRNRLNIPNSYVLRPRFVIYAAFGLYLLNGVNLINILTAVSGVILFAYIIIDFLKLREIT